MFANNAERYKFGNEYLMKIEKLETKRFSEQRADQASKIFS